MISVKNYFILIMTFLFISCEGEETIAGGDGIAFTGAMLLLDMSDDLELTISVRNFTEVDNILFELEYNVDIFSFSSSSKGGTIDTMEEKLDEDNNILSYLFTSNISGDDELVTIKFTSPNYNGEVFRLKEIGIYNLASPVYYTCSDATLLDPDICRSNNETWGFDRDFFRRGTICYINETTSGLTLGDYGWSKQWCDIIEASWE